MTWLSRKEERRREKRKEQEADDERRDQERRHLEARSMWEKINDARDVSDLREILHAFADKLGLE